MAQRSKEYFKENNKKNRQIDKVLGLRYRTQEAMPGEAFLQFKRRMKDAKFVFVLCTWSFGIFQISGLGM